MKVYEQYLDVLQNIESAIVSFYKNEPNLLDLEVEESLDCLIRSYTWEQEARGTPTLRLSDRARQLYDHTRFICEWRLGRQSLDQHRFHRPKLELIDITLPEILICLKHIRQSVRYWNKENGRQGYLTYVRHFFDNVF